MNTQELAQKYFYQIQEHVLSEYPREACGVLTEEKYVPFENVSAKPEESFKFDPGQYFLYFESAIAIVHSHVQKENKQYLFDLRTPSQSDMQCWAYSGKDWLIVGTEGENVSQPLLVSQKEIPELLGRPFIWYVTDCYTIIRDYYKLYMDIELVPDYPHFDWTKLEGYHCFIDNFLHLFPHEEIMDFRDLKNGDVFIFNYKNWKSNHLGVYHNGKIIHQAGLSVEVPVESFSGQIVKILRYKI